MDALISETTFVHDNTEKRNEFIRAIKQFSSQNYEHSSCQDVVKALSALEDKLTKGDQPTYKTKGWEQALDSYKQVSNFCRDILYKNKTGKSDVQERFLSFTVNILKTSLNMLHMQVAYDSIHDSNADLKEYIKNLDAKSLKPLIDAACQNVKGEEGVDETEFCDIYQKFMRQLIRETLTKEQAKVFISELLEQSVYLYIDCLHLQDNLYTTLASTGKMILNVLEDPFTDTNDINRIKFYLKRCGEAISQPSFPSSDKAADVIKDFVGDFVTKLGKRGLVVEFYTDVFDLLMAATKCPYHEKDYDIRLFENVYGFFQRIPKKTLSKNADLFKEMAKRYSAIIDELDMRYLTSERFSYTFVDDVLYKVYADNKDVARQWLELLIPLFKKPCEDTMRASYCIVSKDKGYKWKDHSDIAQQVFDLIIVYQPPDDTEISDEKEQNKVKEFLKSFKSAIEYFFDGLKKSKMLKDYGRGMLTLSLKFLESKSPELVELSEGIAERTELNPKEDKVFMVEMMNKFHVVLKNEDLPWNKSWPLQRAANDFIDHCLEPFKDGKVFTDEELGVFVSICVTSLKYDCVHPETGQFPSVYFLIFLTVINMLSKWLLALNKMNLAEELVPKLMKCLEVDDDNVVQLCAVYLNIFGQAPSGQKVVAPYLEELIQVYLDKGQDMLLHAINEIYPSNPRALKNHFRSLMDLLENTGEANVLSYLGLLFQKVSKKQAELFTEQDTEILLRKAQENVNSQSTLLDIVKELCKRQPESMIPYIDLLLDHSLWSPVMSYWITDMLCTLALYREDLASRVLDDLFFTVKSSQDKSTLVVALNAIRTIGFKYPDLIKPRREQLDEMQLSDMDAINMRQTVLDIIDGKTSEDMLNKLQKQQEDIQDLVGRVDETEEAVADVKDELTLQGQQLDAVKHDIGEQGQHLNQLEETVDETVTKVEEIDQKTLSHAPYWARDVSKLLNPVSEHDWRLLSSRLGYSNDDIRGWAQQADPCMAMLNEWYAVRKTSEATFAVLTQLQEMGRMDAAIIVENAMKNAEVVVEDDGFEYASPPPIFISYQWAHQPEVKLLKQHLEMAGYECWLDIGQMGGGDKLFEKIDKGIRAAKIIISCVTAKYAKSPNCNREVNLAVSLSKPIIPLLLESCTWPPPGSMGPIFSEYLFVRFFQRGGEEINDKRYWPMAKFQELLMQLNMFGLPPNEENIEPEYKNWWMPAVEEIQIDKNKTKNGGQVAQMEPSDADLKAADSPDVFISYQWSKQKNITKLYERLTSLGFSCWLDIKQMGGGDSLFDKIDRGVRGCKVVVSCITQKYALSANCRREVSLADALKKPLLPLLLEQMTWPPSGPMSMVMTQLLYINFTKDESVQMTWDGPQFYELVSKIRKYMPCESNENHTFETSLNIKPSSNSEVNAADRPTSMTKTERSFNLTRTQKSKSNASPEEPQSIQPATNSIVSADRSSINKKVSLNLAGTQKLKSDLFPTKTTPTPEISAKKAPQLQPVTASTLKPSGTKDQVRKLTSQVKKLPAHQETFPKKSILTKALSVAKFSSVGKPSPRLSPGLSPGHQVKTEQLQLTVSTRRLLKPIESDPLKNLPPPSSAVHIPSRTLVRTSLSQQSKISQRPLRLPPLQHSKPSTVQPSSVKQKQPNSYQLKVGGTTAQTKNISKQV